MNNDFLEGKFFSGANSPRGFISRFNDLYNSEDGWFSYIIKGGPGTGKSTLMKKVAMAAMKKGVKTQLIYCSSDPESLDAIVFPEKKICMVDGTAPHVMEPMYPGASEVILNLGECWKCKQLRGKQKEIIYISKKNSALHKRSQRYLAACGAISIDSYNVVAASVNKEKCLDYATRLSKRLFRKKKDCIGKETARLISGITPNGLVFFEDTIKDLANDIYLIDDEYSVASNIILSEIRKNALRSGFNITTCFCPIDPINKIDAIIVPELDLAFAVSNSWHPLNGLQAHRNIHAKRFMELSKLSKRKQRLSFNKRIARELLNEAIYNLAEAKAVHDELEKLYIESMDYDKVNAVAEKTIKEILDMI